MICIISNVEFRRYTHFVFETHQIMKKIQLNNEIPGALIYIYYRGMLPNVFSEILIKHIPSHNYIYKID